MLENIPRILPEKCSVTINPTAWQIPPIFTLIQKTGKIEDMEMYRTFNMGIGLVTVLAENEVSKLHSVLSSTHRSLIIGRVITGNKNVKILF
jgi:phosphoribosylformylglycinamidine cyclo-ligase